MSFFSFASKARYNISSKNDSQKVCVVIPIYKNDLTKIEKIVVDQYKNILAHYPTIIIAPINLSLPKEVIESPNVFIKRFANHYFSDISGYNKLMLSAVFYEQFSSYQFMLIYQLDAYVFEDRLLEWCMKDYDYVGAPWFKDYGEGKSEEDLWKAGNGGFSLRNISSHLATIKNQNKLQIWKDIIWDLTHFNFNILKYFSGFKLQSSCERLLLTYKGNEDGFWCLRAFEYNSKFKVASVKESISFSFENSPETLFEINSNKLPFGCHKWENYLPFWKDYIK